MREQGIENEFIGKNFVFDERRGERISDDIIAQCHQWRALRHACKCANEACHLLFIQLSLSAKDADHLFHTLPWIIQLPENRAKSTLERNLTAIKSLQGRSRSLKI